MSRLNDWTPGVRSIGGARESESPPSLDWQQFHQFLLQRMTAKTAKDRMRYAKQYAHVLSLTGNFPVSVHDLLQLSPNKRIHVMKALSSLARFTGQSDIWHQMRQRYQLSWSTGTEKIDAFTRFFDDSKSLDIMIEWLREAMRSLPSQYAKFFLFCTLTGLRASEAVESVKLIAQRNDYYNPERQILQHYLFPDIFIRRTKAVYISIVDKEILGIAQSIKFTPTLNAIKKQSRRRNLSMQLKFCRKIYASYLHKCGVSDSLIDMLQGRVGKNIFVKHYLTLQADYKDRILSILSRLKQELERLSMSD